MDPWGPIHPKATTSVTLNRSDWPELSSYTCRISVRCVLTAPSLFIFFSFLSKKKNIPSEHGRHLWRSSLCPCQIIASITQCFYLDFYLVVWPYNKKVVKVPQRRRVMDENFRAKYIYRHLLSLSLWHHVKEEERSLLINSLIRYYNWHPTGLLLSVD